MGVVEHRDLGVILGIRAEHVIQNPNMAITQPFRSLHEIANRGHIRAQL